MAGFVAGAAAHSPHCWGTYGMATRPVDAASTWVYHLLPQAPLDAQEPLLRNAYLVTESRTLRRQITGRVQLSGGERKALAELGQRSGQEALLES